MNNEKRTRKHYQKLVRQAKRQEFGCVVVILFIVSFVTAGTVLISKVIT